MDDPVDSLAELEANLRDIERANRFFGGVTPIVRAVVDARARTVLDVGCGSADIPLAHPASLRAGGSDRAAARAATGRSGQTGRRRPAARSLELCPRLGPNPCGDAQPADTARRAAFGSPGVHAARGVATRARRRLA